jgi:hypothetical protein
MTIQEMSDEQLCLLVLESKGRPEPHTVELAKRLKNIAIHVDVLTQRAWVVDRTDSSRRRARRRIKDATLFGRWRAVQHYGADGSGW